MPGGGGLRWFITLPLGKEGADCWLGGKPFVGTDIDNGVGVSFLISGAEVAKVEDLLLAWAGGGECEGGICGEATGEEDW